ncbi:hypothetical protein LY76DRAFT_405668 [Colletotrichum caudatum]|nr:hypothetical protein LY76DRAFT_405668 [Colletotrichum caudatum]
MDRGWTDEVESDNASFAPGPRAAPWWVREQKKPDARMQPQLGWLEFRAAGKEAGSNETSVINHGRGRPRGRQREEWRRLDWRRPSGHALVARSGNVGHAMPRRAIVMACKRQKARKRQKAFVGERQKARCLFNGIGQFQCQTTVVGGCCFGAFVSRYSGTPSNASEYGTEILEVVMMMDTLVWIISVVREEDDGRSLRRVGVDSSDYGMTRRETGTGLIRCGTWKGSWRERARVGRLMEIRGFTYP